MKSNKRPFQTPILILLLVAILLGSSLQAHAVSKRMEDPLFWINKVKDPNRVLLTPSQILKMNEENLKTQDLLLCSVKDMKEEWTGEEILNFLKQDMEEFGKTGRVRYGKQGIPLNHSFWNALRENINQEALKEKNRLLFGLTIKRADVRVFPTEELSMNTPTNYDFDLFQHSAIAPGSLVGIHHFSRDNLWAYVQTPFIRGWIRTIDLAIANNRSEAMVEEMVNKPLVITGNFVRIFADPLFQRPVFSAQMGSTFHIPHFPDQAKTSTPYYTIWIPFRGADGRLTFRNGYIPAHEDAHYGFLSYTQKNLAQQAFKMLYQPYGWGEMSGGRDCSRYIMDLFNTFGILMPRNSNLQARMGIPLGSINRAVPLATLLRMPGHIMLYLGKHEGKHYAVHSIWGIQKRGASSIQTQKIGKVAVTDLNLGKGGPNGSLLHRLTEIQLIGPDSEVKK